MYYPIRRTGWRDNWFLGTCWCEELVKKQFPQIGWCNKWFQESGCGWKRSKKQSKGSYSHYQHNFSYSRNQRNFKTKIIDQPNHPSRHRNDYPAHHHHCGGRAREFDPASDGSPPGKCHGHAAQSCTYLPDSWEGKRDGKGRRHAKVSFFLRNKLQIEFSKPNFCSYLRLPSAIQGTIYF